MTPWLNLTLRQTWNGETYTVTQMMYLGADSSYPSWETIRSMDMQMYRATGMLLPGREWTGRLLMFGDTSRKSVDEQVEETR